jgi:DNA-binding NarL/FixJ family response regulator
MKQPKRVFIVDDHPIFRDGLAHLITRDGEFLVCGAADDSGEALTAIVRLKPELVLLDINLPSRSGLELIKDLLAVCPELAILVVSMHDEGLYAERVLRAGGRGYVMKQEGPTRMLEAMRQVVAGRVAVSPKMADKVLDRLAGRGSKQTRSPIEGLTDREFEILELIGSGRSSGEIARQFHLSPKTVDAHRANIKQKLKLRSGLELIRYAVRWVEASNKGES